ncbi:MAG: hypothetical protein ACOYLF_02715 [Blastocatellia bacterium]
MTRIETMSSQDATLLLYELTGADPARSSAVAELIRHLVSSHSPWRYQSLLGEVATFMRPVREIHCDETRFVLDALETDGDIVVNGGAIHATPIRAIQLDVQSFRFMSSLPTKRLAGLFPGDWSCLESTRRYRPSDPWQVESMLREKGGVLLTPEGWAGLDYEPLADQTWLAGLEQCTETDAFPPESQVFSHRMEWQWLKYGGTALTWQRGSAPLGTRIWRGINLRGYWVYALTRSRSPIDQPWLKLSRNDAHRTIFALARLKGIPIPVTLERAGAGTDRDLMVLTLPPLLPYAEYRYLSVLASGRHSGPNAVRWRMAEARAWSIFEMLEHRLGVTPPIRPMEAVGRAGQVARDGS